ncbi:MAG: DUF3307 domain-containing protein [Bacteroidota bacterium]
MILSIIFVAHWVGDFLLQTTPMAVYKSWSLKWLTIHVIVYTAVVTVFGLFVFDLALLWKYALLNGGIHWVVDFFTSKVVSRYKEKPRLFFVFIGFDQLLHILSLLWTYYLYSSPVT